MNVISITYTKNKCHAYDYFQHESFRMILVKFFCLQFSLFLLLMYYLLVCTKFKFVVILENLFNFWVKEISEKTSITVKCIKSIFVQNFKRQTNWWEKSKSLLLPERVAREIAIFAIALWIQLKFSFNKNSSLFNLIQMALAYILQNKAP